MFSRKRLIIMISLSIFFILCTVITGSICGNSVWTWISAAGMMICIILHFVLHWRCPHCHRNGLRPNPFAKDAGHCKFCGKLVEYKDELS